MKILCILIFVITPLVSMAQINQGLNPEERAYLYHIVKKSPILNNNFGRYFDYQGPEILLRNKKVNFDSIELLIINQPEILHIRKDEIAKSPKGLIAEAANKMALWELNKVLLAKRVSQKDLKQYQNEYNAFEEMLLVHLPNSAKKTIDGITTPIKKMHNLMNPSLSFDDKVMIVESIRLGSIQDDEMALNAINLAINEYVQKRAYQIYRAMGGEADIFDNLLVAAGDGSSTSGMLEEREKDEKGRWNKGLPKAVGLFPYQITIEKEETKRSVVEKIEPMRYSITDLKTVGNNRITNLHFDVWGYNSEKQTTVVIEKNGLNYHLFGSKDTRFLSPDSTFSDGTTYQSIINDLEFNKVAKLNEAIYGKKGFDYWIDYNNKKKDGVELKIIKREKEYSDLGFSSISTSRKASRRVKKSKRNARKAGTGSGSFDGEPTTYSGRKERKSLQNEIVYLYDIFEAYKRKIAALEKQKKEALTLLATYQRRLDHFKQLMGLKWATFIEKDGLYTFEDSTTFDILTQEFQFPASQIQEDFEIRLIGIPESCLSKSADEVMIHINLMDAEPNYNARINLSLEDVFASDKWNLPTPLFTEKDSVAIQVFFEGILNKKVDFSIIARGQGIGKWNGVRTIKDSKPIELKAYPQGQKFDPTFVRLRKSEVFIHINRSIVLEVNSFTDPVKSSLVIDNSVISSGQNKYNLSKNDILSAYRTAAIMKQLKSEINVLAGKYLTRDKAKIVIDRFNKEIAKTKVSVGATSFKQGDLK
ncbi:MAG: hypothetical protein KC454_01860 [Flavobacteriales bacterium]|nr:hypothetical protein [Flavobacteriales bacterium]